ncbi:hypothetical protein BGZ76_000895, partial [Entomortierella beljakovae]
MRSFSILLLSLALLALFVSAQQSTQLPCYQASCSPLIELLKGCQISVDPATGNINFPTQANTTETTDKCLCNQKIVDAFDPCFTCGAENQKIQDQYSTQKLVDSCNSNFGANTVKMPGSSSATAFSVPSSSIMFMITALSMVLVF